MIKGAIVLLIVGLLMILIPFFTSFFKSKKQISSLQTYNESEADRIMRKNIQGVIKWIISGGFYVILALLLFVVDLVLRLILSIQ